MSDPPIVVTNPSEIRKPPNAVLGPHGPKPDANVSTRAATPITDFWEFVQDSPYFGMLLLKLPSSLGKKDKEVLNKLEKISAAAKQNPENRAISLVGVALIFIGFLLDVTGAIFWCVDAVWSRLFSATP